MKYSLVAIGAAACLLATSAFAHGPTCPTTDAESWRRAGATDDACMYYRPADKHGFWFEFRALLPRDADGLMLSPSYRLWVCIRAGAANEPGAPNYCLAPGFTDEVGPNGYSEVNRRWLRAVHHDLFTIRKTGGIRARRVQPQTKGHLEQTILPGLLQCLQTDLDAVMGENYDIDQPYLNRGDDENWCQNVLNALRGPTLPGYPLRSPWGGAPDSEPSTSTQ